jgi:hypothetical protein
MTTKKEREILSMIQTLQASGEDVTVHSVREALGSGSFSTISPIVKKWRSEKAGNLVAPQVIQSLMSDMADQIWTQAEAAAAKRFAGEKFELEQRIEELLADDVENNKEIQRLEEEVTSMADKVVDAETELHNRPTDEDVRAMEITSKTKIDTLHGIIERLRGSTTK